VIYGVLADAVLLVHFAFLLFVLFGGLLVLRRPRLAWLHLPLMLWGVLVEYAGIICPLTPLENRFRLRAGQTGYRGGFIEHYITGLMYPERLTRPAQLLLGTLLLGLNLAIYRELIRRRRSRGG
jgi:Protein of Unknown function (DUF2784)